MQNNTYFKVNTPTVSHETIDGEVVIINLDNGNYYSLTDAGSTIWDLVARRLPLSEICREVCESYQGDRSQIESGIRELLSELQLENLIVSGNGDGAEPVVVANEQVHANGNGNGNGKAEFKLPVLQKYTDMQELLLLDPIHDVDDTGWPRKPE
jgi:coenzyme PQQ synthesis protein D (PqqD)